MRLHILDVLSKDQSDDEAIAKQIDNSLYHTAK